MLYFINERGVDKTWHVGSSKPKLEHPGSPYVGKCVEVQADGDELEYILALFRNRPVKSAARILVWKGELAQFIYDNI